MKTNSKIGVIFGRGTLPDQLRDVLKKQNRPAYFIGLEGSANPKIADSMLKIGQLGKAISIFKKEKVENILFIGGLNRPAFNEIKPDITGGLFLLRNAFKIKGDNSLLTALMKTFENKGFKSIGIHEIMPNLVVKNTTYTRHKPTQNDLRTISYGMDLAKKLGEMDVGQSVVVQGNLCLGLEAIEGTDALINRCAELARGKNKPILVKMCKPQQDKRLDMPTIGYDTIREAIKGGYAGIAVESESVLFLDSDKAIKLANTHIFFIIGLDFKKQTFYTGEGFVAGVA